MTTTKVDAGRVVTAVIALLRSSIGSGGVLIGDNGPPDRTSLTDAELIVSKTKPYVEVWGPMPIGPAYLEDGLAGQAGAMEWVAMRIVVRGKSREQADYALAEAVSILVDTDPDGSYQYDLDLPLGMVAMSRKPHGRGQPQTDRSIAVSEDVRILVHAAG